MKHITTFENFVNERLSMEAVYIHQITSCGQDSAQNFIDDNNIDGKKLADYVKQHKDSKEKYDVRDMIKDPSSNKKLLNTFVNESFINEGDEVSVDSVLSSADKKKLKTAFETVVTGVDKLTFKKNGTIEGRRGYFYRHGQSPQSVAEALKKALSTQGIEIQIVDSYDDFKPWPKDSNFVVVFKLK
jgi:hypothetical protein